jgi:hypothetical protein
VISPRSTRRARCGTNETANAAAERRGTRDHVTLGTLAKPVRPAKLYKRPRRLCKAVVGGHATRVQQAAGLTWTDLDNERLPSPPGRLNEHVLD